MLNESDSVAHRSGDVSDEASVSVTSRLLWLSQLLPQRARLLWLSNPVTHLVQLAPGPYKVKVIFSQMFFYFLLRISGFLQPSFSCQDSVENHPRASSPWYTNITLSPS